jgi:hypothetical protein
MASKGQKTSSKIKVLGLDTIVFGIFITTASAARKELGWTISEKQKHSYKAKVLGLVAMIFGFLTKIHAE